jgi:hypothetical protein
MVPGLYGSMEEESSISSLLTKLLFFSISYYCRCLVTLAVVEGSYHLSRSGGGGSLSSLRQRGYYQFGM